MFGGNALRSRQGAGTLVWDTLGAADHAGHRGAEASNDGSVVALVYVVVAAKLSPGVQGTLAALKRRPVGSGEWVAVGGCGRHGVNG